MSGEKFRKLIVWEKAHRLVIETYRVTKYFPSEERYGLVSQMRRAAVVVTANIVEGTKRKTLPDRSHFHVIADTSLEELKYYLQLSKDLEYFDVTTFDRLMNMTREVGRMLHSLNASL